MAAFAPVTHFEIHLHLAQSSSDEKQQHFVSSTEQKRFKVADKRHKILLYQFVLIVLEGTSLWKRIDFFVFSQRHFNSLCTCCHIAKAHKQDMSDTTTLNDQPFSLQ